MLDSDPLKRVRMQLPGGSDALANDTMLETARKRLALAGLSLSAFVAYLDFAIVNTALPSIQRDLSLTFVQLQWVMNIFVLALCILMVNMGRFGDIFGRRVLLYTGLACFVAASLLAGLAPNGPTLIAARAFQGFAITMIVPSSLALVSHSVSPREQGRAIGIWTSITGVGLALGPVEGGLLTSALSWRWIFFVNIPIVAIAFVLCSMSVEDVRRSDSEERVDWAGFLLMIVGIGSLACVVVQGPEWGWTSQPTIALALVAIVSLGLLYVVESNVKSPILNLALFANRAFVSGAFANFTLIGFAYSAFFLMPLYLRSIVGKEAYETGFLMLPITLLIVIVAPIAGKIVDIKGAKLPVLLGLLSLAVSALVQSMLRDNSSLFHILTGFVFVGIGWGLILSSAAFSAISSLPHALSGTASGALWTVQNLGGSIGLAIAGTIFRHAERTSLMSGLAASDIHLTQNQQDLIRSLLSDSSEAKRIIGEFPSATAESIWPLFRNAFIHGYSSAFLFLLGLSLGAFLIVAVMMKNITRKELNVSP
jgi:EmrB/QacA subfamily drug resistance transporter